RASRACPALRRPARTAEPHPGPVAEIVGTPSLQPAVWPVSLPVMPRTPTARRAAPRRPARVRAHRIVMLAFPGAQILDVTGPLEVFAIANRLLEAQARRPGYQIELVATSAGPLRMSSGLELIAQRALHDVRGPIDTLFVPGGEGTPRAMRDEETIDWIR